ncbi:MAG: FtsX-like permease family protein, partial [Actinomycetota bacterium]
VLALLGCAALAHVLVTSIRRRRRDLAILKTLGFVRGQARRAVAWQATVMVVVAGIAGVPLGIVAGRSLWNQVASGIGVLPRPATSALVLIAIAPVVVVLANLIAVLPARTAARTKPALVLRSE